MHSKGAWNHSWRTCTGWLDRIPVRYLPYKEFRSPGERFGARRTTWPNAFDDRKRIRGDAPKQFSRGRKTAVLPGRFAARSHSSEFIGAWNAATRTRARKQHSRATRLPLDEIGVEEPQSEPGTVDVLDNGSRGILVSRVTRPSAYHYGVRTPEDSEGGGAAKVARLDGPKFRQGAKPPALGRIVAPIVISMRRDAIGIATHRATSVAADGRPGRCTRVGKQLLTRARLNERVTTLFASVLVASRVRQATRTPAGTKRDWLCFPTNVETRRKEREYQRRRGR